MEADLYIIHQVKAILTAQSVSHLVYLASHSKRWTVHLGVAVWVILLVVRFFFLSSAIYISPELIAEIMSRDPKSDTPPSDYVSR